MLKVASSSTSIKYAGFWRRLLAIFIDSLLVYQPLLYVFKKCHLDKSETIISVVLLGFVPSVYNILLLGFKSQTIGMMLVRFKIFKVDMTSINWKNAFLRYVVNVLLALVSVSVGIYFLNLLPADNYLTQTYVQIIDQLRNSFNFYDVFITVSIALTFSWTFSEVIVLLFNEKKRAIHDYIAGTVVICI